MESHQDDSAEGTALAGRRVLVVEDDFLLAEDVCDCLRSNGAEIVGPAAVLDQAMKLAEAEQDFDCAVLDMNLRGKPISPVARILAARSVPFIFVTGYQTGGIDEEFAETPRLVKPFDDGDLVRMVQQQVAGRPEG